MTTYLVKNGGQHHEVTIVADGGDEAVVRVGERELTVRLHELPDGAVAALIDGTKRRFRAFENRAGFWLSDGPRQYCFDIANERESWLGDGGDGGGSASGRIEASMPGRVVKLAVAVGDTVAAGGIVAVLEAMKMENDVKSPTGGEVLEVAVTAGDAVEAGQLLVRLEPAS